MNIPATQICDDYDFIIPAEKLMTNDATPDRVIQVGTLSIGSSTYPIKQGITKIGRLPECSIVLTDQTVSKKHAEIEASCRETAWICDLNSSNKTRLNNAILRPGRCYELKNGSELDFGTVHAIYNVYPPIDDSVVPATQTPASNHQKNVIPETPDSSLVTIAYCPRLLIEVIGSFTYKTQLTYPKPLHDHMYFAKNNSSTWMGKDSTIPSTPADEGGVFRRLSTPQRNSSCTIKKTIILDSSSDERVSIHDLETQKTYESHNETDIHDVETQKVCLDDVAAIEKHVRKEPIDIHDMETQRDEDIQAQNTVDINDMETQPNIGMDYIKTPNKIEVQDVSADKSKSNKDKKDVKDNETKEGKSSSNNADTRDNKCEGGDTFQRVVHIKDEPATSDEHTKDDQKSSQECLQLSPSTNFEDDCSELDGSRALVGSQNLLCLLGDDDPLNISKLKSSTSEVTDKSTDDENIFDAATQVRDKDENIFEAVTQRINYRAKASQVEDDSDESNQDCLFQRYSRVASQDSQPPSKSQLLDSEDSDTDEEGRFAEIAVKEKRVSVSFEARLNGSKEATSGDSEDMFDAPTQRINRKRKNSSTTVVDFDTPTQVIQTKKSEDVARMKEVDIDDMAATQILPTTESSPKVNEPSIDLTSSETEVDYNAPTQIVDVSEKVSEFDNNKVPVSSDVVENSTENMDYETAPTQLISEHVNSPVAGKSDDRKEEPEKTDISKSNEEVSEESSKTANQVSRLASLLSETDDDDDILAAFPEVRISGTLSNPASPTLSNSSKSRKSTRKTSNRKSTKYKKPSVSRLNSPPILEKFNNFDVDESDDKEVIEKFKQPVTKTTAKKRKIKESGSQLQQKPISSIDSPKKARHSPSIQGNRRTRNSSKENVDSSSVFQMGTEALDGNATTTRAKRTTLSSSRARKRSLSSEDAIDTNKTKKRREGTDEGPSKTTRERRLSSEDAIDTNKTKKRREGTDEGPSKTTRERRSSTRKTAVNKKNSETILDYATTRNSPVSVETSRNTQLSFTQESIESKQLMVKVMRLSPSSPIEYESPRSQTEPTTKDTVSNETKPTRRASIVDRAASNKAAAIETEKAAPNIRTRGKKNQKATNTRRQLEVEVTNPQSEESQEVEMIMSASLLDHSTTSGPTRSQRKHKILFTGINKNFKKLLTKLGASQVEDASKCSVLVTDKVRRTVKFLCALGQSVPIVSVDWLLESEQAGHFLDVKNYMLKDPAAEAKFGFKLRGSLEKAKEQKLLEGYTVVLTPNVAPPPLEELKSIITSCGGKALKRPPAKWPQKAVVISQETDLANAKKFIAKAPKTVTCQSTEFLLTGILRQELEFNKYKLTS